jgi:HK97 family phage portal protein
MLLDLLFGRPGRFAASEWSPWPLRGWMPSTRMRTASSVLVDEEVAMTYSAVWCATRVIADPLSFLPLILYRKTSDDDRRQATEHPLFEILKSMPNPDMGSVAFREARFDHQINWGNAFAEIEWDNSLRPGRPRTRVLALWPIHPSRVRPVWPGESSYEKGYRYRIRGNDNQDVLLLPGEMLHVPGVFPQDGIWGKGVIQYARESIGSGLATERYGAAFFGSGGHPKGVINAPGMKDPAARRAFRSEWKEIYSSPDAGELAVLPIEVKYQQLSLSNEDNQFLETRKFGIDEIARWYKVPPHKLASLDRATHSNIEQQEIDFVVYSLLPWARKWEEQIKQKLLLPEERDEYYAEFLFAALLRGDTETRYRAYDIAIRAGFLTINEARRLENLNGIGPAGDLHFVPLNMTTAEAMLRLANATPPAAADEDDGTLDGGQLGGLVSVTDKVALGEYPAEGARAILEAAFPEMDRDLIETMVEEIEARREEKEAEQDEAQPPPPPEAIPDEQAPMPPGSEPVPDDQPAGMPEPVEARNILTGAVRVVLIDTLRRMLTREANAAKRKADSPRFLEWLAEFHADHRRVLAEALTTVAQVASYLRPTVKVKELADYVVNVSALWLTEAYNTDTKERFAARLERWSERARELADELMHVFLEIP